MTTKLHQFIEKQAKDACENYLTSTFAFLKTEDDERVTDLEEMFNLGTLAGMKKAFEYLKEIKAEPRDFDEMETCECGTLHTVQLELWHFGEMLDFVIEEQKEGTIKNLRELREFMKELEKTIEFKEAFPC